MTHADPVTVVRACLQAYVDKDRAAIERLIAEDFSFSSPLDNQLDRKTYFARCWPNSASMGNASIVHHAVQAERVFVIYEADMGGKCVRNAEMHTVRGERVVAVEVYFGWNLPHPAPLHGFVAEA